MPGENTTLSLHGVVGALKTRNKRIAGRVFSACNGKRNKDPGLKAARTEGTRQNKEREKRLVSTSTGGSLGVVEGNRGKTLIVGLGQ